MQINYSYPIGWLKTAAILKNYEITDDRTDGGKYPFAALPIRTSELKDVAELIISRNR